MSSDDNRNKKLTGGGAGGDEAAVEELLRAAQDDVLLKLRLNSHSVSSDSHFSSVDPDLSRRFDALKSKPSAPSPSPSPSPSSDVDDLESRFAKLKGGVDGIGSDQYHGDEGMEDEVEKMMKWAMDAARLDQSSGKSTTVEDEIASSESESSDDEDEKAKGKKVKAKKGKAEKRKWFF